ncbi:hypothetical protein J25TS5_01020 [Paenibacillus faecis]|uniref:hypothetical protein n=1 Tax=Paenibacillus faecis TaxID=862114 RepID=UPI001B223833|nr:hypothetical protein [Paenibacillus faecis]GIO83170.1 hypothetical protein J25TS5_01020 [Paenibacillus faecis]
MDFDADENQAFGHANAKELMRYGVRFEKIPPAQTLAEKDLAGRTFRHEAVFTARRFDDGLTSQH